MKKTKLFLLILLVPFFVFSQKEGYKELLKIKQPYHNYNATKYQDTKVAYQKANGLKLSESQKYLFISYAQNPTHIAIYHVGTWKLKGVYKIMGPGVDLYSCYMDDAEECLCVR
ncbi:MAG: hypothetical protein SNJ71_08250, partial [Bacteroidales bacterium]